jgi:hypothetical protein
MNDNTIRLFDACYDGDLAAVKQLTHLRWLPVHLGAAADATLPTLALQPIPHVGGLKNQLHMANWFALETASLDARTVYGGTPLHNACYNGHLDLVKWIVGQNCDLLGLCTCENSADWTWEAGFDGGSPLTWAELRGHQEVVDCLKGSAYYGWGVGEVRGGRGQGVRGNGVGLLLPELAFSRRLQGTASPHRTPLGEEERQEGATQEEGQGEEEEVTRQTQLKCGCGWNPSCPLPVRSRHLEICK